MARENFGPRVAQVAAAALLIDYVVTVAVQAAAGTVAVASAIPALGPYSLAITVGLVLVICYANLRGLREAGVQFAAPTYFFVNDDQPDDRDRRRPRNILGIYRPSMPEHIAGTVPIHQGNGLVMGATVLVLLRAFANGGSSLTGVEAISNTVDVFRKPQGRNARRVLTVMAFILAFLLAGVAYLTFVTHATPYVAGYPSVLSQVARAVFGNGAIGNILYILVQASTAAILFTGANTSFNGFPALASFVAEDRFLPRQLTKRGYRLVFSNGIMTLTALSVALLLATGGSVTALVPFYAIGVFTGFSMAGYGMTKHHLTQREPGWRRRLAINLSAGILSTIVVGIFAVAKFTEGAWLVVVVFPVLVFLLIRLNREYRAEAAILEMFRTDRPELVKYARHRVFVFVNSVDLAVIEALRYGRGLRSDDLVAVHFMVDAAYAAQLRKRWDHFDLDTPLRVVDCPDRRINRAAQVLVAKTRDEQARTNVTVLLPRRTYAPLLGRLLHDRTADKIARAVSLIPDAAATIVPYDVESRIKEAYPDGFERRVARELDKVEAWVSQDDEQVEAYEHPERPPSVITVAGLIPGQRATFEGRVNEVEDISKGRRTLRQVVVGDNSGEIRVTFRPGRGGADIQPGQLLRITGKPKQTGNRPMSLVDPAYHVVEDPAKAVESGGSSGQTAET